MKPSRSLPVRGWWSRPQALILQSALDRETCLRRLRESLPSACGAKAPFNGWVDHDSFAIQLWWGWFSPTRRALVGTVTTGPQGTRIPVWIRLGLIAQLGGAVAAGALLLLDVVLITRGPGHWLVYASLAIGVVGLAFAAFRNPLQEDPDETLLRKLVETLEAVVPGELPSLAVGDRGGGSLNRTP